MLNGKVESQEGERMERLVLNKMFQNAILLE